MKIGRIGAFRKFLAAILCVVIFIGGAISYAALDRRLGGQISGRSNDLSLLTHVSNMFTISNSAYGKSEVGVANLLCARGLPCVAGVDEAAALRTLDAWAKRVEAETARHLYRFRQNPFEFNNSEAYFRMLTLVTVLQEDCGVRYNPERMHAPNFADSRDLFLHGLLTGKHQGTCVSMPVLYVAVGRKLGYPLKLVTSKAHVFARWESPDGRERLNIEATSQGLNCFPDEYYHTWPVPLTSAEIASGQYLKSLTPNEELAVFLSVRGHCLEAAGRLPAAQLAYAQAHQLAPVSTQYLAFLAAAVRREMPEWQQVRVDLGQTTAPSTPRANP